MVEWIVYGEDKKRYTIKDIGIRTTPYGEIPRKDLLSSKKAYYTKTTKGERVLLLKPQYIDIYSRLKRGAQPINQKDCGLILAETLVGRESVVFDCGSGMGGLTCFLARYVKKVFSMDCNEKHLKTVKENVKLLSLKNVEIINGNVYEGIPIQKKFDLMTIDVPEPEKVVSIAKKKLKLGGFFVAYCPQALQMHAVSLELKNQEFEVQTIKEVIVRKWAVEERILRPEHISLVHTGFLIFARKIR